MCCHRVTHMLLWITSEQSTTLFTSIYKTSKGDIHIPSQDHFIHLLGVYDVHIVLVEVWVHLVMWVESVLRDIGLGHDFVVFCRWTLTLCLLCNSQWTLTCWLPSSLLFNLDISHSLFLSPKTMMQTVLSTHPQRPSIIITVDPIIGMVSADLHTFNTFALNC